MKNLENYVVLDLESGTYFCAANAVLIDWQNLDEDQRDAMINGTDTERCLLADEIGISFNE